jgi:hypothetical protein
MISMGAGGAAEFLEAIIAAFSILGGGMAYFSGYNAAQALSHNNHPEYVAEQINVGIGEGFRLMAPLSILALIIVLWS